MYLTVIIIIILAIVFIIENIFGSKFIEEFSFSPLYAFNRPWTWFTAIFLHYGFFHIFVNAFTFFFFGLYFEYLYGKKHLLILFLLSGIFGNLLFYIVEFGKDVYGLGASGAISGIMAALAVKRPYDKVIIFPIIIPIPLIYALFIWIFINVFGIIIPIGNAGYAAHIGGIIMGLIYSRYLKEKNVEILYDEITEKI